ncbi:MAG: preprotein translocase subunit Sec61beta [archaeon]|nr:preprotein translocase subunit Sec61beta [archaeon]
MKFTKSTNTSSGPSSAIGIMRFTDTDTGGPKMSPEFVVAVSVAFALIIAVMHFLG